MKKLMILLSCALIAACGNQTRDTETGHIASINNATLQKVATQALNTAVKEHAQTGNILIMDMSGNLILDHSVRLQGDSLLVLPNGYETAIEPGALLSPMLLASIIDDPNMHLDTAMLIKVGRQYYPGPYCVEDDGASIEGLDSMPLHAALAVHSNVGMCELGEIFYSNCRDSLKTRLFRTFPIGRIKDLKVGSAKSIRDMGRMIMEGETHSHNSARRFYLLCRGYGLTVYPKDILGYYNSVAGGHSQSDEILKNLLLEEVESGAAALIKTDAYMIAGRSATIASRDNPSRCTACFVGFFPADNPLFSCMVTLYESIEPGRSAAMVFRDISDELMQQTTL